ncbi:MAG: hypothetical protein LBC61_06660 [Candidatus Peribacteria bacterium]|nr:hypothetical protein [Candidatus Peribacteria bacterium]
MNLPLAQVSQFQPVGQEFSVYALQSTQIFPLRVYQFVQLFSLNLPLLQLPQFQPIGQEFNVYAIQLSQVFPFIVYQPVQLSNLYISLEHLLQLQLLGQEYNVYALQLDGVSHQLEEEEGDDEQTSVLQVSDIVGVHEQ